LIAFTQFFIFLATRARKTGARFFAPASAVRRARRITARAVPQIYL
jgi:hypothetical protein